MMRLDDPGFNAELDRWIQRDDRHDYGDDDCGEMTREIDDAEARDATMRARCVGCGLPRGAHTDVALAGCGALS